MDLAYDHIQEQAFPEEKDIGAPSSKEKTADDESRSTLSADVQDAYRAFSSSPWGARIGGFFGAVAKQGESIYHEAQHELSAVGQDASTGFTSLRDSLISRTRSLSLTTAAHHPAGASPDAKDGAAAASTGGKDPESTPTARELSTEEAIKESETVLSRLKLAAAQRLKDIQKAEDAADEALLKFGSNIRDFLRDSIKIAPPSGSDHASSSASDSRGGAGAGNVLFESKDAQGKRVIHTSRFDAQLHVIHTNPESFAKDPASGEYASWSSGFNIDKKTDDVAADLAKYPELRTTMEKLVPDSIPYPDFWKRYYFLRHSIETAEARRRDLLKAASAEEDVGWDEDSEDESTPAHKSSTAAAAEATITTTKPEHDRPASTESSTTIQVPANQPTLPAVRSALKPSPTTTTEQAAQQQQPPPSDKRASSNELDVKSQADSDASYDLVGAASGVPSQAPNSPRDAARRGEEESDEEDWE